MAGNDGLNRPAMGAHIRGNDDFNSETTACAESTIADLYNRVGDGCAAHKTADHGGARITEARRFVPGSNSGIDSVPRSMDTLRRLCIG